MACIHLLLAAILSTVDLTIADPVDGAVYGGDWLTLRIVVENDDVLPDSVSFTLNGGPPLVVPRLSTDWPTYMQSNLHHGFSESPAPVTSEILWTAPVCEDLHVFENPTVVGGVVYQVGLGRVYALDAATGEELWNYQIGPHDDPPSIVDGRLYVASDSIYCIDASSGQRIWASFGADVNGGTPCVMDGHVACATGSFSSMQSTVYCLSAEDGQVEWTVGLPGVSGNCIGALDGIFFAGTRGGPLCALDAGTGQTIWSHTLTEGGYWDTSPTIVDGKIYIGGEDGSVHRFDAMTGALEWETPVTAYTVEPTPAVFGDLIICGAAGSDGSVFALHMADGSVEWSVPVRLHGSPAVADGLAFWGGVFEDGFIYAADASTGEIVWQYDPSAGAWGLQGTPAVTDGVMYFPCTDGNLYAFGTGLIWTYRDDLLAEVGPNELIASSWSGGSIAASDTIGFTVTQTGLEPPCEQASGLAVHPNPCTSSSTITFLVSSPGRARITVFDLCGRIVSLVEDAFLEAGTHSVTWSGVSSSGDPVPPGCYIVTFDDAVSASSARLVVLRE